MWSRNFCRIFFSVSGFTSGTYVMTGFSLFHADNKQPSPNELTLQSVQVFFRHGARTPLRPIVFMENAEWPKDKLMTNPSYPSFSYKLAGMQGRVITRSPHDDKLQQTVFKGGSYAGHLTTLGKEQMYELGKRLRKDYVEKFPGFIDTFSIDSEVYVRSTNILRTVESAVWVMNGLFDAEKHGKEKPLTIFTDLDEQEILYPNVNFCIKLKNFNKGFFRAVDDIPGIEKNRMKLSAALNYQPNGNGNKKLDYQELRDELSARLAHGIDVPKPVMDYLKDIDQNAIAMLILMVAGRDDENRRTMLSLSCGAVLDMLYHNMLNNLNGTANKKIYLFSAHDSLMMAFLQSLNIFDGKWPPFAADIRFELYKDKSGTPWVRVLYLGKPQRIRGSKDEFLTLDKFKESLSPFMLSFKEFQSLCASEKEIEGGEVMDVIGGSKKDNK